MTNIDIASLPQNIQQEFAKFEQCKEEYAQLQDRLNQLQQRLDKHRKAAEATHAQAQQLDAQWREAFRQNDGELTKEIRAMKNSAQESRDFSEEYKSLANALRPEFELIQIDTAFARKAHIESLKNLKTLYADYMLEKSAADLFSLPQAKIFLACVNHKYSEIEHEMNTNEIYVRMTDDEQLAGIKVRKEGGVLTMAAGRFLNDISAESENSGILGFKEIKEHSGETQEKNQLTLSRRKIEIQNSINNRKSA